jgi:NAD(P)-dependent dehydrogenase (short-subunit alcohol dehydrogenase family)
MSKALRVLITGAARGIGMATAQILAKRGHSVVATDISALTGLEGIQAHVLDVTSDDSVARCLKEVGTRDAIVNNAGIFDGLWREAAGDFGGVLAEFLNVPMSELRKGGKDTITGQPQVDDFSASLRSE